MIVFFLLVLWFFHVIDTIAAVVCVFFLWSRSVIMFAFHETANQEGGSHVICVCCLVDAFAVKKKKKKKKKTLR
eukprot:NODE_6984_length_424_cov_74.602667_g5368_i0.p2 GENE.NODE_6984_length_424_cov_74.602667_g5368_i0~~NODE_6984_length_424_cov_74.602667_g5368_i0.p2  ORF type:complete len:74 (-),score=26.00 NODE_6984_length_424_cov_74.602667_g5368_i0:8-229(-)